MNPLRRLRNKISSIMHNIKIKLFENYINKLRDKIHLIKHKKEIKLFRNYTNKLIHLTKNIEGDIVECGVYRGYSLLIISKIVENKKINKKIFGFDSFRGFTEVSQIDNPEYAKTGKFGNTSKEGVIKILLSQKISKNFIKNNIRLIEGDFSKTLPSFKNRISFLHLDCDLYKSYKICLKKLYPLVNKGGIIAFDEYLNDTIHYPGGQKAINEFFKDKKHDIIHDKTINKYYYIKNE